MFLKLFCSKALGHSLPHATHAAGGPQALKSAARCPNRSWSVLDADAQQGLVRQKGPETMGTKLSKNKDGVNHVFPG